MARYRFIQCALLALGLVGCSDDVIDHPLHVREPGGSSLSQQPAQEGERSGTGQCARHEGLLELPRQASELGVYLGQERTRACLVIDGDLVITQDAPKTEMLSRFDQVDVRGDVRVSGAQGLATLSSLRTLSQVSGDMLIEDNPQLERLDDGLAQVSLIEGDLHIVRNPSLKSVNGVNALERIGGDLIVEQNDALTSIQGFSSLALIAEYPDTESRPPSAVEQERRHSRRQVVDPHLIVRQNPSLQQVSGFVRLTDIDGDLRLEDNPELEHIEGFGSLEFVTGTLSVRHSPKITNLRPLVRTSCLRDVVLERTGISDLSAFESVIEIGGLELLDNPNLTSLVGPQALFRIAGPVRIDSNPVLSDLDNFFGLQTFPAQPTSFTGEPDGYSRTPNHWCVALSDEARDYGHITVRHNNALKSLGQLQLTRLGTLTLEGNDALGTLGGFDELESLDGDLIVRDHAALKRIEGFEALTRFGGDLRLSGNAQLTALAAFDKLESIDGSFILEDSPEMTQLNAGPRFKRIGRDLRLRRTGLEDLDALAPLQRVGGDLAVAENPRLATLNDFPALSNIDGALRIESNQELRQIRTFEKLKTIRGGLYVQDNPALPSCEAEVLVQSIEQLAFSLLENNGPACP